jgi:hypothetical protein
MVWRSSEEHDMEGFPQTQQQNLDGNDALELDGLQTEQESTVGQEELETLTPLKKQCSGRKAGGVNQWTFAAEEICQIIQKKRQNRAFPPQTLVWAKLDNCPWWPARVCAHTLSSPPAASLVSLFPSSAGFLSLQQPHKHISHMLILQCFFHCTTWVLNVVVLFLRW